MDPRSHNSDSGNTWKKPAPIAFYGFRGGPGGINFTVLSLMNELASAGHEVHLLLHNSNIPERKFVHEDIKQIELPGGNLLARSRVLSWYLKESRPAAVISVREPGNRALIAARQMSKQRTIAGLRVGMPISIALARRGLIKRFLRREAIKFCYKRAEVIIANHGAVAKDISEVTGISEHLIHVIPNGTVSQLLYDLAEATPDHPWLSKKDSPVVLAIGRLAKQKDFSTLIRAFHTVRAELNAKLIILGEGKERSNLQSLINRLRLDDCVHLYGYAENPYCFLNRADLFVLSSAWEGLPNVLIEAIALGVPSVATDCKSGPREILEDGRLGPLVPVGDDKAMAESILHTLATPPNRDLLVKSASRYRADTCAKRYLEALKLG